MWIYNLLVTRTYSRIYYLLLLLLLLVNNVVLFTLSLSAQNGKAHIICTMFCTI